MPKIRDLQAAPARVPAVHVEAAAPVAAAPAVAAPAPAPLREPFQHAGEDHIVFANADGTRSRICICVCDDCWPPAAGKNPPPCDWSV